MTASGLPAVLIRFAMSVGPGVDSGDALLGPFDRDDIAEIAESIDEFLGAPFASSARTPEAPAIVDEGPVEEPPRGFGFTTGSETLRLLSFGNRREGGAGPGLLSSGVVAPEDSLL
jgi:hypothetical protein